MSGVDARCPRCLERCDHHYLDLWECPECGRFWDASGEVVV